MRRRIDAHMHIWPAHICGALNTRYQVKYIDHGRVITEDGSTIQMLPEYFHDTCFSMETLMCLLEGYHIERAVILQSLNYDITTDLIAACAAYGDRIRAAMAVEIGSPTRLRDIEYLHEKGLTIMKFECSEALGYLHPKAYPDLNFASPVMNEIFDCAENLQMTVTIDTSPVTSKAYQTDELYQAASSHPGLRFVLCHLGFPYIGMREHKAHYEKWKKMTSLARLDNVWFDVSTLPNIFGVKDYPLSLSDTYEPYPFPCAMEFLREFLDAYGSHKAIWGTDVPSSLCSATYGQMIEMFENCSLFTEAEKDRLFYDNAVEAYFKGGEK